MDIQELIAQARTALADEVEPYLWSDEALLSYFNEAVQEACERALLIQDMHTPEVCHVALVAGQGVYRLHPSVLKVERATMLGRPLDETSIEALDEGMPGWEDRVGQPSKYVFLQTIAEGHPALQLVPAPKGGGQLKLRVYRGALRPMELNGSSNTPEIPARHHHKLVNWVARCAYLRPDADGHDAQRAQLHDAEFTKDFGQRPDANVQRKQRDKRPRLVKMLW